MPVEFRKLTGAGASEESLLPELLHALSQPLTALRCSLELTLLQPRNSEEYRKRLRESLDLTKDITTLTAGIRELLEVEQPGSRTQTAAFDKILQTTVRELLPVADSMGVGVSMICAPALLTHGDGDRFYKALFYLIEFFLSFAHAGDELSLQASPEGDEIAFVMQLIQSLRRETGSGDSKAQGNARTYLAFLIARRVIEVEGGRVEFEPEDGQISLRARLPLLTSGLEDIGVDTLQFDRAILEGEG
jgi:K+-sensing histidine kinase KdpD